ncbi:MAG: EfeM/EfeO family lipoprotein [Solirubrobacteraceae bacterium]
MFSLRIPFGVRPGVWILGAIFVLAACTFVGSALAPDGSGKAHPFSVSELAPKGAPNPLAGRLSKVYGTNIPASRYGTEIADLEDEGTNLAGEQVSDLSPIPPSEFTRPENEYRAYAQRWVTNALSGASSLGRALVAGNRAAAQAAWGVAWSDYLHLGAVYGLFAQQNQAIDGIPGALPGGTSDLRFVGLHRIEMGLWTGQNLASLIGYDKLLEADLKRLHGVVAHAQFTPLEYATRSHEIIEDAQRDLLSGMDVPWSKQGVLGTAAGLAATEEVFHTLEPLISGRENTEGEVRYELLTLSGLLASIRHRHHGIYPSLTELGSYEHEQLNGYVAGTLSALEQMPGVLETEVRRRVPKLPQPSTAEKARERAAQRTAEGSS